MDVSTPVEYMPWLILIGLVVGCGLTLVRGYGSLSEANLKKLREGAIVKKMAFGMDYLAADLLVCIVAIIGAYIVPGAVYDALHATPVLSGCVIIAIVFAVIIAIGGQSLASYVVDVFLHNPSKIADAETIVEVTLKAQQEAEAKVTAEAEAENQTTQAQQ